MPYNIAISTKILTLATTPILFILVGVLSVCEVCYGARSIHFTVPSGRRASQSSKRFKSSVTTLSWQGHC